MQNSERVCAFVSVIYLIMGTPNGEKGDVSRLALLTPQVTHPPKAIQGPKSHIVQKYNHVAIIARINFCGDSGSLSRL